MERTFKFIADGYEDFCPCDCGNCPLQYTEYVTYDEGDGYFETDVNEHCVMGWTPDDCKLEVSDEQRP